MHAKPLIIFCIKIICSHKKCTNYSPMVEKENIQHSNFPIHYYSHHEKNYGDEAIRYDIEDNIADTLSYLYLNILIVMHIAYPEADSKEIVDRPTKRPLNEVVENFRVVEKKFGLSKIDGHDVGSIRRMFDENIKSIGIDLETLIKMGIVSHDAKSELENFLDKNFEKVGSDLVEHEPIDYKNEPEFLKKLGNKKLKEIALSLHGTWPKLSRKQAPLEPGKESTLIKLEHPFFVPGGRFREYYYWDTNWILAGLLVSGMKLSAENIIKNFIDKIQIHGYVPNGTRKYYVNRSQPPYFTQMLFQVYNHDREYFKDLVLNEGIQAAAVEHVFWSKKRSKVVIKDGKEYEFNYYHVKTDFPRPESFGEDVRNFKKQKKFTAEQMYTNLKSGAESGWDFSTRWLSDPLKLDTIVTTSQIPVDLNSILYSNEVILSKLFKEKGDVENSKKFRNFAKKRKDAINTVLWNKDMGVWNDYDVVLDKHVTTKMYISNILPLFYGIDPPENTNYHVIEKAKTLLFGHPGGIPASDGVEGSKNREQWDFPNVWAPHQHMAIEYFKNIKDDLLAYHVARCFFNSVYSGYEAKKGCFYEKYQSENLGAAGGGGEYAPQSGFGWTNGVSLYIIDVFGDKILNNNFNHRKSFQKIKEYLNYRTFNDYSNMNQDDDERLSDNNY